MTSPFLLVLIACGVAALVYVLPLLADLDILDLRQKGRRENVT
jgi:hypothetical protein